jgi:hypothetical protein
MFLARLLFFLFFASPVLAQSTGGFVAGQTLPAASLNAAFQNKADYPYLGVLPFVQAFTYTAGSSGSLLFNVRGTIASPNLDGVATAGFQSVTNFAGTAPTVYISSTKNSSNALAYGIGVWSEVVDLVGGAGSSVSAVRTTAVCSGGTGGNCTGATNLGICTVAFTYCIGTENQVWNQVTDAATPFSALAFSSPMLSSCSGTKKCTAGFLINPNGTVPDIYGLYFPAGTIDSSGSAINTPGFDVSPTGVVRSNTGFNANGSAGLSVTKTVRASGGASDCTLIFTQGLLTGGTC